MKSDDIVYQKRISADKSTGHIGRDFVAEKALRRDMPVASALMCRFSEKATKQMLARSAFYVNEGSFGRLKGRALAMLEKHGGSLDRSTFLKNLSVNLQTFKSLIATLLASGIIEADEQDYGKIVYHVV